MDFAKIFTGVLKNDRREFDTLVNRCHRQAYNVAFRLTGNHADAEDLTQESFLRAFRFFGRYDRSLPFENWLYRIMSRVFIDELRKRPRLKTQSLDQPLTDSSSNSSALSGKKKMHNDVEVYEKKDGKGIVIQSNHVSKKQNVISNFNRKNVNGSANNEIDELENGAASNVKSSLLTGKKVRRSIVCDEEDDDDDDEIINTQDDDKSYNDRNRNKLMKEKRKLSETFPIRQSSLSSSSSSSHSPSPSSPSPFSFARTAQSTAVRGTVHDQHLIREKPKHSGKIVGKLTVRKITSAAEESRETDENSENQNVDEYSTASYKRGRADSPCW